VVAALVVRGVRPGAAHAAALLAVAAITALHDGSLRRALPGQELLAEVESRMQFLQVVRERSGDVERTTLRINEGLDSHHSLAITGTPFTGGAYYDWHALAPLLVGDGTPPRDLRVLSIGDAAGTLRTVYAAVHPGVPVDAVDVDPATMALGDRWFPGPKAAGERFVLDGRVFLAAAAARWHVIHVDAYAHQVYVPAHLASVEFFRTARERLHEGGLLACNVGALQPTDPVLLAIGASMKAVFGHARALLLPNTRNALLVARRGDEPRPERLAAAGSDGANLTAADRAHWQRLLATASASPWFDVGNGASPLVDDRPLLDRLLARSYVDTRDTGERVECRGDVDVPGAEIAAFGARQRRDWSALLDAVRSSRAESALLREYAGDARWSLRELRSAAAEYERAAGLAADEPTRARLRGNLAYLADELGPVQRAEASARRNGWLQWLLVGAAAVTVAVVWRASARSSSPAVVG
jgi:spermidine synthase